MPDTLTAYLNERLAAAGLNVVRPVVTPHREFPQVVVEWAGFEARPERESGELRSICNVVVAVGYLLDDEADVHVEAESAATSVGNALLTIPGITSTTPRTAVYALTDPRLAGGEQIEYRAVLFRVEAKGVFRGDSS